MVSLNRFIIKQSRCNSKDQNTPVTEARVKAEVGVTCALYRQVHKWGIVFIRTIPFVKKQRPQKEKSRLRGTCWFGRPRKKKKEKEG